jgi:hypothetical protein
MVNFSISYPFKGSCFSLIYLLHTELMWSETPRQLSQCRVRIHVNWVNAEWDSTSTESTQKAPTFMKISSFHVDSVDMEFHSTLTQSMLSLTPCWLSQHGDSLCVDSVDGEWGSASPESLSNVKIKKMNKSVNLKTKSKTLKSLTIWHLYAWSVQKTEQKISCKCTFNQLFQAKKSAKQTYGRPTGALLAWWIECMFFCPGCTFTPLGSLPFVRFLYIFPSCEWTLKNYISLVEQGKMYFPSSSLDLTYVLVYTGTPFWWHCPFKLRLTQKLIWIFGSSLKGFTLFTFYILYIRHTYMPVNSYDNKQLSRYCR